MIARKLAAAVCLAMVFVSSLAHTAIGAQEAPARAVEADAHAAVLAVTLDVAPAFDPALAESRASSSSVGSSSLNGVAWPGFLVDAFFFLYGFQSVERVGAGISEARWPQGPTTSNATQSDLVFANGGDAETVPGSGGTSISRAGDGTAEGTVSVAQAVLPGGLSIGSAASESSVDTRNGSVSAAAGEVMTSVRAGPLSIDLIDGRASARADHSGASSSSRLVIAGASVSGTAVEIDDEGVRAISAAAQEGVDGALAGSGVTVKLVPAARERSSDAASASSGGVLVLLAAEQTDPSGTPRSVRIGYLLGASSAGARSAALGRGPVVRGDTHERPRFVYTTTPVIDNGDASTPPAATDRAFRRRVIVVGAVARPSVGARGAYAALLFVALGLILMRPLMRAAARP